MLGANVRIGMGMLAAALAVVGGLGCGGSTVGESGDGGGVDAGGVDGSVARDDGGSDAAPDAHVTPPPDDAATDAGGACDQYCKAIMGACTGPNAQYPDTTSCMAACSAMDPGKPSDTSSDTLSCRRSFAELAKVTPSPNCWSAGPFGYGRCGQPCDTFCRMAATRCSAAGGLAGTPPYNSEGDCILHCAAYTMVDTSPNGNSPGTFVSTGYSASGPVTGDTLDCREFYLMRAFEGAAEQLASCGTAGPMSANCR